MVQEIERIDANNISAEEFFINYWNLGRPVIIENALNHWPALNWDLEDLKNRFGNTIVSCRQTHSPDYRTGYRYTTETMTVKFINYFSHIS